MKNKKLIIIAALFFILLISSAALLLHGNKKTPSSFLHVETLSGEITESPEKLAERYLRYIGSISLTSEDRQGDEDTEAFLKNIEALYQNAWHRRFGETALEGLKANRTATVIYNRAIEKNSDTRVTALSLTAEQGVENGYNFDMEVEYDGQGQQNAEINRFKGYIRMEQGTDGWMIRSLMMKEY